MPKIRGKTKIKGIKKIPWRQLARKMPCVYWPVAWTSIFVMTAKGKNGKDKAKYPMILEPVFITLVFCWKNLIICDEKKNSDNPSIT